MIDLEDSATKPIDTEKMNWQLTEWLPILGILILIGLIYCPILNNAFNGDDFVHLKWLSQAIKEPELIWRNFHSAWLDITTAKFYRPLISLFMVSDYLLWRGNGMGFHLTNLLCHLANTALLWLVLRQLSNSERGIKQHYIWCLASAALFGLYPLHPEAVSWITGRVDCFVTLFFLASIYSYICWRAALAKTFTNKWFCLSLLFMAMALMCKEMAIILPALFLVYELIIGNDKNNLSNLLKTIGPFWILLFFYFFLRYFALGTFIGGYDNTVFALNDLRGLISTWFRSGYHFLFPFNQNILGKHNPIVFLWSVLLLGNLLLTIKYVFIERKDLKTFVFIGVWLLLSLIPVYKLFNISGDIQGSRLAYLPSAPLCALLCFGYGYALSVNIKMRYLKISLLALMISAAGAVLLVNNSAWIKAETSSQAILKELDLISRQKVGEGPIYIIGLPDQIDGAYVCRNALEGMSKWPQISKDINYCFNLNEINHVFPFGYARQSMLSPSSKNLAPEFYVWDSSKQKLKRFSIPFNRLSGLESVLEAKKIFSKSAEVLIDLNGCPCFNVDCLSLVINFERSQNTIAMTKNKRDNVFRLFYTNDLYSEYDNSHQLNWNFDGKSGERIIIFPLHGQVDWAMGGNAHCLKLVLLADGVCQIKSARIESIDKIMPQVSFQANANQNSLGFIELSNSFPNCNLTYDCRKVIGAQKTMLEFSAPDQTFAVANDSREPASFSSLKELQGLNGLLLLNKRDFPSLGIYELRLWAFDSKNRPVGIAGDHIVITVK